MKEIEGTSFYENFAEHKVHHLVLLPSRQRNQIERKCTLTLIIGKRFVGLQVKRECVVNFILILVLHVRQPRLGPDLHNHGSIRLKNARTLRAHALHKLPII